MPQKKNKTTRKSKLLIKKYGLKKHKTSGLFLVRDELCKDRAGEFMLEQEGNCFDVLESPSRFAQAKCLTAKRDGFSDQIGIQTYDNGKQKLAKNFVRARFLVRNNREMLMFLEYIHGKETRTFVTGLADVMKFPTRTKNIWVKNEARTRTYSIASDNPIFFSDRKINWLIVDDDGTPVQETDLIGNIREVIIQKRTIIKYLFQTDNMVISLSSKYGVPDKEGNAHAKLHIFLRLKETVLLSETRALINGIMVNKESKVKKYAKFVKYSVEFDKSVLIPVQPIYEGPPIFVNGKDTLEVTKLRRCKSFNKDDELLDFEEFRNLLVFGRELIGTKRRTITSQEEQFHWGVIDKLKTGGEDGNPMLCPGIPDKDGVIQMEGEPLLRSEPLVDADGHLISYEVLCYIAYLHSSDGTNSSVIKVNQQKPVYLCSHTVSHADDEPNIYKQFDFLVKCGLPPKLHPNKQLFSDMFDTDLGEFSTKPSNWTMKEIQENYIHIRQSDEYYSRLDKDMVTPNSVRNTHPEVWQSEEDKQATTRGKTFVKAFAYSDMNYEGGQSVKAELFNPNSSELILKHKGLVYLNAFRGFHIQPIKGDTSAFYEHIALICPDEKEASSLIDYIAHIFQKPGERPTWSPVHVSISQGLGRGLLSILIGSLCEPYTETVNSKDILEGQFNEYLKNSLWVGIEETDAKGKQGVNPVLKHLITVSKGTINIKHKTKLTNYQIYTRLFFMTNDIDALPLETSDRRFWVIGPNDPSYCKRDAAYYTRFSKHINNEGFQSAVMHDLIHRDISKFKAGEIPFKTELKVQMQVIASAPEEKALMRLATSEYFPRLMTVTDIIERIDTYLSHVGEYAPSEKIRAIVSRLPKYNNGETVSVHSKKMKLRVLGGFRQHKKFDTKRLNAYLDKFRDKKIPMDWWKE